MSKLWPLCAENVVNLDVFDVSAAVNCKVDGAAAAAAARFSARGAFLGLFWFRCGIHHRWMLFERRSEAEFKNGGMLMSHSVAFCNSIFFTVAFHDTNALQDTPRKPRNTIFPKLVLHNPQNHKSAAVMTMNELIYRLNVRTFVFDPGFHRGRLFNNHIKHNA